MGNETYNSRNMNDMSASGHSMSAMAIVGFVLSILAVLGSWIPLFNNLAFFAGVIGLVFSIVGLIATSKGKKSGKGLAVVAVVLNIFGCVVVLMTQSFYSSILGG